MTLALVATDGVPDPPGMPSVVYPVPGICCDMCGLPADFMGIDGSQTWMYHRVKGRQHPRVCEIKGTMSGV